MEALATTDLNILLDVGFNREVGMDGALYFNKEEGSLSKLIDNELDNKVILNLGIKAKDRIVEEYSWINIVDKYEKLIVSQ